MKRTILTHDTKTAKARIRFEHNGVTYEDNFDLDMVMPGSKKIFEDMKVPFDETFQLKALDHLTGNIQRMIEEGSITNKLEGPAEA